MVLTVGSKNTGVGVQLGERGRERLPASVQRRVPPLQHLRTRRQRALLLQAENIHVIARLSVTIDEKKNGKRREMSVKRHRL